MPFWKPRTTWPALPTASSVPPVIPSSMTKRSKTLLANRPIASAGRTMRMSIASSKYHLL